MIRGLRVKKRVGFRGIEKLIKHVFPATRFVIDGSVPPVYRIRWNGDPAYAQMRALANEIQVAAAPAWKGEFTIVCRREAAPPPWPAWKWVDTFKPVC
jgi:hypothetical protein